MPPFILVPPRVFVSCMCARCVIDAKWAQEPEQIVSTLAVYMCDFDLIAVQPKCLNSLYKVIGCVWPDCPNGEMICESITYATTWSQSCLIIRIINRSDRFLQVIDVCQCGWGTLVSSTASPVASTVHCKFVDKIYDPASLARSIQIELCVWLVVSKSNGNEPSAPATIKPCCFCCCCCGCWSCYWFECGVFLSIKQ